MNTIGVCGSFKTLKEIADRIDFVEELVQGLLVPSEDEEAFAESSAGADAVGVPVLASNCFLPGSLRSVGPEVDLKKLTAYADNAFRRAQILGMGIIVYGSGGSRQLEDGQDRGAAEQDFINVLKAIAPSAAKHNVLIVVEPLNSAECNFINSLAEGAEVVKACNHPNVKLLADIYHMAKDGETPDAITTYGELLRHVHIAEKEFRTPPGTEGDDFRPYLRALSEASYRGAIALECKWEDVLRQAPPAVKSLRSQIDDIR